MSYFCYVQRLPCKGFACLGFVVSRVLYGTNKKGNLAWKDVMIMSKKIEDQNKIY